jgi:hypothetical protein
MKISDKTKAFIKAAGWRCLRTFAQAAIAAIGSAVLIQDVDWLAVASTAGLAAILSILTSIITGLPEVKDDGIFKRD